MIAALLAFFFQLVLAAQPTDFGSGTSSPMARLPARAVVGSLEQGAERYAAADYRGSQAVYQELLKIHPHSAELHYNLGNALFKAGRLGPSIAEYQRAFDINPNDPDIRFNLAFALKRAGEELIAPGVPETLFALFYFLSLAELAGLAWLFCWVALTLGSIFLAWPAFRKPLKTPALAAAVLWLAAGSWYLVRQSLEPLPRGIIVSSTAEIRSGPGEGFGVSFTAPEGRRVQIISASGGWLEIGVLKERAKGWIAAEAVEKI